MLTVVINWDQFVHFEHFGTVFFGTFPQQFSNQFASILHKFIA